MGLGKKFGKFPDKHRKEHFQNLPNYSGGKFQNVIPTLPLAEGETIMKVLRDFLRRHPETEPRQPIPHVITDLKNLRPDEEVLVWFGHSSYFIQINGLKLLIDPVFSGNASPVPGSVKAFPGSNVYQAGHLPEIDVLLISHDHWDHLDYPTIKNLRGKVKKVVCGMGVAQHFEYWGWQKDLLMERNWDDTVEIGRDISVTLTPARHFSGRLFSRNISLWISFVLQMPERKFFLGGDSGYGPHFREIGDRFGPFDLAMLECGQYNTKWPYIHMLPEEITQAAKDLKAKHFMPVHHSKFKLAQHPWYEPLEKVTAFAQEEQIPIITPMIGEKVHLDVLQKVWKKWWQPLMPSLNNETEIP